MKCVVKSQLSVYVRVMLNVDRRWLKWCVSMLFTCCTHTTALESRWCVSGTERPRYGSYRSFSTLVVLFCDQRNVLYVGNNMCYLSSWIDDVSLARNGQRYGTRHCFCMLFLSSPVSYRSCNFRTLLLDLWKPYELLVCDCRLLLAESCFMLLICFHG